jgi:hypothetical protein
VRRNIDSSTKAKINTQKKAGRIAEPAFARDASRLLASAA